VSNEIISGHDWFPTLMAAVGDPGVKAKLLKGYDIGKKTFKVHIDGYNQLSYLTGLEPASPRHGFFYFDDDGDLVAVRVENWKIVFEEQRAPGTMRIWAESFTRLRVSKLYDLRSDPYEKADITSNTYYDWLISKDYIMFGAIALTEEFLQTFKEFPPAQLPGSGTIDQAVAKMRTQIGN
jgi:arylsulfatase